MSPELRPPATIWQAALLYSESAVPAQATAVSQLLLVLGALSPGELRVDDIAVTPEECLNTVPFSRMTLNLIPVPLALHVKVEVRAEQEAGSTLPVLGLDLRTGEILLWSMPHLVRVRISEAQIGKLLEEGAKERRDLMPRVQFDGTTGEWALCASLLQIS